MTCTTPLRMRAIHMKTRRYRARCEARRLSRLTACSLTLLSGILLMLRDVHAPGVAAVADGYGSVLLKGGASAYIVVGLAAFAAGVAATVLCIRMKNHASRPSAETNESED